MLVTLSSPVLILAPDGDDPHFCVAEQGELFRLLRNDPRPNWSFGPGDRCVRLRTGDEVVVERSAVRFSPGRGRVNP